MIILNKRNQRVRLRLLRLLMTRMPSNLACVLGLRLAFAPFLLSHSHCYKLVHDATDVVAFFSRLVFLFLIENGLRYEVIIARGDRRDLMEGGMTCRL